MSVRSIARALKILDCFDPGTPSLTLHQISERIELPKSTTFRILQTLVDSGYLMHVDNIHYGLSLKILRLGNCVLPNIGVQEIARPEMLDINEKTKETVALHEFMDNERVIIDVVECSLPLTLVLRRGETTELTSGATGKVFLAHNLDGQKKHLRKTRQDKAKFDKEMKRIRKDGYAMTTSFRTPGSAGVAVPIFDMNDECRHSIGIYGPETRVIPELDSMVELLISAADRISARAGSSRATQE